MKDELEYLIGRNVIYALTDIMFNGKKKVEIPLKLKSGIEYKITVEGAIDE